MVDGDDASVSDTLASVVLGTSAVHFGGKPKARIAIAELLGEDVPDFEGADAAAERLVAASLFASARRVAVATSAPQRFVRERLEARGVEVVPLDGGLLPAVDVIVTGAIAVTSRGQRCGRGLGTTDFAFAAQRERGFAPPPVVTTIDERQLVRFFPSYEHDVDLTLVATPERLLEIPGPQYAPSGIRWSEVTADHRARMPWLAALRGAVDATHDQR